MRIKMAVVKKLRLLAALTVLLCVYAVGELLYVLFIVLRNPRKALRRTARDSKRVALAKQRLLVLFLISSSGVSVGPGSGFPRVRDSQWTQVPLCLCRRHVQTSHVAASWLPRGHLSHPSQSSHTSHASHIFTSDCVTLCSSGFRGVTS